MLRWYFSLFPHFYSEGLWPHCVLLPNAATISNSTGYLDNICRYEYHFQVPRRGWWVTGGINAFENDGISTTDLFNTGNDDNDEVYGPKVI